MFAGRPFALPPAGRCRRRALPQRRPGRSKVRRDHGLRHRLLYQHPALLHGEGRGQEGEAQVQLKYLSETLPGRRNYAHEEYVRSGRDTCLWAGEFFTTPWACARLKSLAVNL